MIHYIVSVYVGTRGNRRVNKLLVDPTDFVRRHIETFSMYKIPDIKKATFVVSPSNDRSRDESVVNFIKDRSSQFTDIEISAVIRENNNNFSYGSWEYGMKNCLHEDLHFFLIEDDYIPYRDEFYLPFVQKSNKRVGYVAQWYVDPKSDRDSEQRMKIKHAAISNGLITIDAARAHHRTYKQCINLVAKKGEGGNIGVLSQMHFLDNFVKIGLSVEDLYDDYCHPFLNPDHSMPMYGKKGGEKLLVPVFYSEKIHE